MTKVFKDKVHKESLVVSDRWWSTPVAVEATGSTVMGSVNHGENWRDPETGIHSNDAESEWARLNFFLRTKYGWVRANNGRDDHMNDKHLSLNIAEYLFYTNVGREFKDIMKASILRA